GARLTGFPTWRAGRAGVGIAGQCAPVAVIRDYTRATMEIEPFLMERMQSVWENRVPHNLSESGVHPMTVAELLEAADAGSGGEAAAGASASLLSTRLAYVQSNGSDALRSAIAALYPATNADEVVVTNGTAEANYIAVWRLVEAGDEVVLMLPNYMQIWGVLGGQRASVVPLRLREENGWSLDPGDLRAAVTPRTKLIAVCNPNNPTGSILSKDSMAAVAEAASKVGAWILSDEVYRGAERDGVETPTFRGLYDRLLVTAGLSKAYGLPGLRIGWVVGPAPIVAELWGRKDYLTIAPGALSEPLGRAALGPHARGRILERTRRILNANFPVLEQWVRERPSPLAMVRPRAGAIAWIRYRWKIGSLDLVARLRDEQGVLMVPGEHFGMDRYLRIGFGNEPEDLREGLARVTALTGSLAV